MGDIIEFIKELLTGKKMDAKWIVTIAIAVAGLAWSGTLVWQEYQGMQGRLSTVEGTPPYDDAWAKKLTDDNMNNIITLQALVKDLQNEVEKLRAISTADTKSVAQQGSIIQDHRNQLGKLSDFMANTLTEVSGIKKELQNNNISSYSRKLERMEEKLNRAIKDIEDLGDDGNPLSM